MKNTKISGFTLIELLAVIIILSIVALIATPIILDVIDDSKKSAGLSESNVILSGIINYCSSEEMKVEMDNDYEEICTNEMTKDDVSTIVNLGNAEILDIVYLNDELMWLKVKSNDKIYSLKGLQMIEGDLEKPDIDYSGANNPQLLNNMIPIRYDGTNWIYTSTRQIEWYNYDNKEWANAVVLKKGLSKTEGDIINEDEIALWYVWIPRYKYQLFNVGNEGVEEQEIKIEFENNTETTGTVKCSDIDFKENPTSEVSEICTNAELGNWYTHPAFTFGSQQLTGFWVGKFEVSTTDDICNNDQSIENCNNSLHNITIKPNVSSLRYINMSNAFFSVQNISEFYSINGDSHVIKNMEWGAVAYLSHSKYGTNEEVYINNSSSYYTGRSGGNVGGSTNTVATQYPSNSTSSNISYTYGYYTYDGKIVNYDGSIGDYVSDRTLGTKASTTGNIYGVYDMSGGANELVMGTIVNFDGNFFSNYTGFSEIPNLKYYDSYTYSEILTMHSRGKLGDGTKETLKTYGYKIGSWYDDYSYFPHSNYSWFNRGGYVSFGINSGVFYFGRVTEGENYSNSTRAVLSAN